MIKAAIVTISDKGSKGQRKDETGKVLQDILEKEGYKVEYYKIIPDDINIISEELIKLCDEKKVNLIITNGGTGFSKRDVTPEATEKIIEKYVPGFGEAMRASSLSITPKAILSRGIAGIRKDSLIINLPGSPKAAVENLQAVLGAIPHGIEILLGEASECAR
ncbi:molybdopterin adenylyltransferase [Clostridium botulinum]|uniref:Molybdenum cofactor biosynthesis protein B n=2 Tax=Clostridium botulinum TaxID=1491 RepID=A0A6B4MBM5_CLOBO|nr:molybdopterin adenylyltransferase [Clostridium botulinum]AJD28998.1 molybdenum cofactor synthesis domain protein [Clostridium botulinum CDC_297]ACQ51858.1 molybdopterin biosynthesis enzyme Mog [Clostridium botulinum Ba4 str. 657]AJE10364.1 molybdenum cofactor synthesis domain protein [Clostridium botulinum CDC_1436]APC83097.1 molybdenum cofactor synthesis domain protein [Clostridium botulinum]APU60842.1 molybdenum cofactor synthesis domain protein [Clostridium botulinum]